MFNVFNRSQSRDTTIRQALAQAGVSAASDPSRVAVVEKHGQYSGRRVTFFRAFNPGHQDVLLASGHVEHDGSVAIGGLPEPPDHPVDRVPANRAKHADDEKLVFTDAGPPTPGPSELPA